MNLQIIEFASEMKSQLKKIKNENPNSTQWEHFYKHFKKLYSMIKQLSQSKEKLPEFFQSLHTNTIDMRMKLLADLAKQENKRKRIQRQYEKIVENLQKDLQTQNKNIIQLQMIIKQINGSNGGNFNYKRQRCGHQNILKQLDDANIENKKLNQKLKSQRNIIQQFSQKKISEPINKNDDYQQKIRQICFQLQKAKAENKNLNDKLKKQVDLEKTLRFQILRLKDSQPIKYNQNNTEVGKSNKSNSNLNNNFANSGSHSSRRLSPSPDKAADNINHKISYQKQDNILASFSQYPNQNYTQLDNTYSQQETQRKAKSVYTTKQPIIVSDDLWRLILLQATSLEQFLGQAEQ